MIDPSEFDPPYSADPLEQAKLIAQADAELADVIASTQQTGTIIEL